VLRLGSNTDVQVEVNGEAVLTHRGRRHPLPDQDSILVRLVKGANTVRLTIGGEREAVVYLRCTDPRGLPIEGVE
jgi:hypothetical protein